MSLFHRKLFLGSLLNDAASSNSCISKSFDKFYIKENFQKKVLHYNHTYNSFIILVQPFELCICYFMLLLSE